MERGRGECLRLCSPVQHTGQPCSYSRLSHVRSTASCLSFQKLCCPLRCVAVPPPLQVEMWVQARRRVPDVLPGLHIEEGERVLVEISRKFTPQGGTLPANVLAV